MLKTTKFRGRGVAFATLSLLAAVAFAPNAASAGECPPDQRIVDATAAVDHAASGVTDTVVASIDLATEPAAIAGRLFRLRQLVIDVDGVVPWHSHGDRPAIIYIVAGEITEYASNCAVPIVHRAGEVATETHATSHWWKNTGAEQVILLSADLLRDETDHNM